MGGLWGGGGGGWRLLCAPSRAGGGRRWELRPAWPLKPGGVPWARGPLRGRTSDSPGGTPLVWYGMVWYGMVWYGMVWYGMVWYGMVWYGMVWYGMVWYGMVWYGMVWYGMVWYGMVWYGMLLLLLLLRHPARAGGSSRPALRWPGGRRRRPRGVGGWGRHVWGGGGGARARRREEPPVCVTLEPSPAVGGRVTRPVRDGGGMGGWLEGPPVRGPAGPRFPLLPAAAPPRQGRGRHPV